MKKFLISAVFMFFLVAVLYAQAPPGKGGKQLNVGLGFSGWGVPVYVGADFGVHDDITVGPRLSYRNRSYRFLGSSYRQALTVIGFNGNYHFNRLLNLEDKWNLYAGLTLGYYLWSDSERPGAEASGIGLDAQIGGRYFFTDKLAVNLEFGGGTGVGGGSFGLTIKL
jgi:hypothetical protein